VGHRRWLRKRPAPPIAVDPADLGGWPRNDWVDGREAANSRRPVKNVSLTADPS
jgi:hypothetical protein